MKYWFFDGSDIVGPFSPQELLRRKGFSVSNSLVCPENFSEDEDSWKTASSFADFGQDGQPVPSAPPTAEPTDESTAEEAALFDKEMDTFLKNPSILAGTAEPAPDGPALEIPKKPAKPGPIEDYFNNINSEDLGGILGIPEPNENSDMNLPRAFEKEFEETVPPSDKEIDFVEADAEEAEEPAAAEDSSAETADVPVPPNSGAQETEETSAPQTAAVPHRVQQEEPSSIKLVQDEPSVTISVVEENAEPVLVLPAHCAPEQQPETACVPAEEDSAPAEETPSEPEPDSEPEPEPENLSTCTLPLVGSENEKVSLPEIPKDDVFIPESVQAEEELFVSIQDLQEPADTVQVSSEPESDSVPPETAPETAPQPLPDLAGKNISESMDNPASDISTRLIASEEIAPKAAPQMRPAQEVISEPEELVPAAKNQQGEQPADLRETVQEETAVLPQEDPREQTVRDILRGKLTIPAEEELKEPLKTVPIAPEVNQIKPKLNQTPEITRFLDRQSRIIRHSQNKKADMMLWILACLLALGVLYAILRFVALRPAVSAAVAPPAAVAPSAAAAAPSGPSAAKDLSVPPPTPVLRVPEVKPVLPPTPLTAADKALAAVQNYRLSGDRGTIASYFDRIYKTKLSQGYTGNWSAEALHKNIYIVKYRLSKTRLEPVVYVFQADAAREKLTGALNNAALDLVGKI